MLTAAARRSIPIEYEPTVDTLAGLERRGWSTDAARAQLRARRWQRIGRAVVLHNGAPSRAELMDAALINHGPRSVLTSFTTLERAGMTGWLREQIHVLVPAGARVTHTPGTRTHYTGDWSRVRRSTAAHQVVAAALVLAAGSFNNPRPACGILAAGVQQRLTRPVDLVEALGAAPRVRHRAALLAAVHDIGQGAEALSEIDFAQLCRRHGLPPPLRQRVRLDSAGRRRYVDAEWIRRDGRRVVVEIDGALHLIARRWWDDQLRQNELVIAGDIVLRFPSVIVRADEDRVAAQLARVLLLALGEVTRGSCCASGPIARLLQQDRLKRSRIKISRTAPAPPAARRSRPARDGRRR